MDARKIDEKFDNGESVLEHFDMAKARRPNREVQRVNVDFPRWMVHQLDQEATRVGVTRQSIIKMWLAERLDSGSE